MDSVSRFTADVCDDNTPVVATFEDLRKEIRLQFNSDSVDDKRIRQLMMAYLSIPEEWIQYAKFDQHAYTRNLVDEGNEKYNLVLLSWGKGQGSKIHDHAASHCCMKVLSGELHEVRYSWPNQSEGKEMEEIGKFCLKTNDVAYMNDNLGLHLMKNSSDTTTAVSLHLYWPPFQSVLLFDPQTGHTTRAEMAYWNKYGSDTSSAN